MVSLRTRRGGEGEGPSAPLRLVAVLPHLIVLALLAVVLVPAAVCGALLAAVRGRRAGFSFDLLAGGLRWLARVVAYLGGLSEEYPPFALYERPTGAADLVFDPPEAPPVPRWQPLLGWLAVLPQLLVGSVALIVAPTEERLERLSRAFAFALALTDRRPAGRAL